MLLYWAESTSILMIQNLVVSILLRSQSQFPRVANPLEAPPIWGSLRLSLYTLLWSRVCLVKKKSHLYEHNIMLSCDSSPATYWLDTSADHMLVSNPEDKLHESGFVVVVLFYLRRIRAKMEDRTDVSASSIWAPVPHSNIVFKVVDP